jgi:hypothetical protein
LTIYNFLLYKILFLHFFEKSSKFVTFSLKMVRNNEK